MRKPREIGDLHSFVCWCFQVELISKLLLPSIVHYALAIVTGVQSGRENYSNIFIVEIGLSWARWQELVVSQHTNKQNYP